MKEVWKSIYGNYEVSNLGNLRSIDRHIIHSKSGLQFIKGKLFRPNIGKNNGYYYVSLRIGGRTVKKYIHDLVCLAFYGSKPAKNHVDHIDKNRLNNCVTNLRYISILENCRMPGESHPRAKLKTADIIDIRNKYSRRELTQQKLADLYGVDFTAISLIIRRKNWRHI